MTMQTGDLMRHSENNQDKCKIGVGLKRIVCILIETQICFSVKGVRS